MNTSFSAFQQRSMEANGYRERAVECIRFLRDDVVHRPGFGPPLSKFVSPSQWHALSAEMSLSREEGHSISVMDLDITEMDGLARRWICIEISKPLIEANGQLPRELHPMPQSFVKIAVPVEKIELLSGVRAFNGSAPHSKQASCPGGSRGLSSGYSSQGWDQRTLRLRMSKDGIPLFTTRSKSEHLHGQQMPDDFLSASNVTGLPWQGTDRRTEDDTMAEDKADFWEGVRMAAQADRKQWISLQQAMAQNKCFVEIFFGEEGWNEYAPAGNKRPPAHKWPFPNTRQASRLRNEVKY
ncbi:hypothetical protein C8035_v002538 [Colletotrichum spinosum]|uniref:Uncharacterized protein n=1 Tax=Colletotrichum spinosum TaxID=1347390 RepID=A0A4R8QB44_9PEZI|nr:hypothetical protein C8035_v002538 [Colletotrichum spinosum]